MESNIQRQQSAESLNWTGYIYGGLAHSSHLQYGEEREAMGEASVRRGLQRMGLRPEDVVGRRVMEVGTGLYGLGFHRLGAVVEHRDVSTRTVQALTAYARTRGYGDLKSIRTDLVNDPLPEEHFDLIYLSGIFQHFQNPSRALMNVSHALKVGGHLYVDFYRSGRWRWFVADVLRKITDRSLLYDVLLRFTEMCALGQTRSFHLRQVEYLIDDLFVEHLHAFHPDDLKEDAQELCFELVKPATSMNLLDTEDRFDHSLFFPHIFNTLVFRKARKSEGSQAPERTKVGRCQINELAGSTGSYGAVADLTAEFVLAHQAGRFRREEVVSHIVNLSRMARPCLPGDPYMAPGKQEPAGSVSAVGDEQTMAQRHSLWCTFLANVLNRPNPLKEFETESLGFELIRFLPKSS